MRHGIFISKYPVLFKVQSDKVHHITIEEYCSISDALIGKIMIEIAPNVFRSISDGAWTIDGKFLDRDYPELDLIDNYT